MICSLEIEKPERIDKAVKIWDITLADLITKMKYYATRNICPRIYQQICVSNVSILNMDLWLLIVHYILYITYCTLQMYHSSENKYVRDTHRSLRQERVTLCKWPSWCTIPLFNTSSIIILCMIRATLCSSSGGQIVLILYQMLY